MNAFDLTIRYDLVIHFVTAANGAEDYYTLSNNAARSESINDAKRIDNLILEAWASHPKLVIIDNKKPAFEDKMKSCLDTIYNFIGLEPTPDFLIKMLIKMSSKFISKKENPFKISTSIIHEEYLDTPDEPDVERKIRRIEQNNCSIYNYYKTQLIKGQAITKQCCLSPDELNIGSF